MTTSLSRRYGPLRPLADMQTYRTLLFLVTGIPLGALWLAMLTTGWALTVAFAITPLVIVILLGFSAATALAGLAERTIARDLLGAPGGRPRRITTATGYWQRGAVVLKAAVFWKTQVYLLARALLGTLMAAVELGLFAQGLFLATAPIHYRWLPQDGQQHGLGFGSWIVDTLPEALLLVPVGVLLVIAGANLAIPFAALWRGLSYALLGGTMTDVDYAGPSEADLRRVLAIHATVFGVLNGFLILIWALTNPTGYFWPIWTLLPLGLILAAHAWVTLLLVRPSVWPERLGRPLGIHAGISTLIIFFLTAVWAVTTPGEYFWPIWPALGLSIVVLLHLIIVLMTPDRTEMENRIEELTSTRAGAVDAQDAELRRIERDLHDGAQARLVALGMSLGLAEQRMDADPDAARQLLVEAKLGAREALEELRDLARGIHPPVLADRGLGAAVSALAARSPIEVSVSVVGERPPAAVESAAYFVTAEALANATKHATAQHVEIRIARGSDKLSVEVTDDGSGGADPSGAGLTGLRRRVEALDGRLIVDSPAGGPTVIRAELPCVS
ncbi:MAG TPA: sensor histidine kinase [Actinomycetes bacterium]|nr:sensor histidine kinase [Actinomycetes bacterium]